MKTKLLTIVLLAFAGMAWGQEEKVITEGNYYFNYPDITELNSLTFDSTLKKTLKPDDIKLKVSGSKYRITVTKIKNNNVYFVFGKFSDTLVNNMINKPDFSISADGDLKGFFKPKDVNKNVSNKVVYNMKLDDFKDNTKVLYQRVDWRVGVFTIPYKLRFSDFTFDANVNIGVSLGGKIRLNRELEESFALEPIVGFGLASIKLDDGNSSALESTNVSAFTINTGFLVHITNNQYRCNLWF